MLQQKKQGREIEDYFKFIQLYNQERDPEVKKIIDDIVQNERSLRTRINRIRELDEAYERGEKIEAKNYKIHDAKPEKEEDEVDKELIQLTGEPLYKVNQINFFFKERRRVKDFADLTFTIKLEWLGFRKHLTSEAFEHWHKMYYGSREYLTKTLNFALSNGWKFLEKPEYNKLVVLWDFINSFLKSGEAFRKTKNHIQNVKIIETFIYSYLILMLDSKILEHLKEYIEKATVDMTERSKIKSFFIFLEQILEKSSRGITFLNVILATYMLHFNRYVTIEELYSHYHVKQLFEHKNYNFPNEIHDSIREHLNELKEESKVLERELYFLKFIDEELSFQSYEHIKYIDLFNNLYLYEHVSSKVSLDALRNSKESGYLDLNPFESVKRDVARYLLKFVEGFSAVYEGVLKDVIPIEGEEKSVSIFAKDIFNKYLTAVKGYQKELEDIKSSGELPEINGEFFTKLIVAKRSSADKELKITKYIMNITKQFYELAEHLSNALFNHNLVGTLSGDEKFQQVSKQNQPIKHIRLEPRLIPHAEDYIGKHHYLTNRKVIDLLHEICYILVNTCYLYRQSDLYNKYYKKDKIIKDVDNIITLQAKIKGSHV